MENKSAKAPTLVQCVLTEEGMASGKALAHTETLGVQTELQALKSFLVISFATTPQIVWCLCEQMIRHLLCEYRQVYPRGGAGGRLPVVRAVTKCLLPCSGKTKLVLETNKSSPSVHHVVLMCYPPAVGSDAGWLQWGSSSLLVPQCRMGVRRLAALEVPTPHPLMTFWDFLYDHDIM